VLETLLLPLGIATAKAVARIWIKSELALTISDQFVEKLAARVPGLSERRRTARQFQDMADRVAAQLLPLVEHENGGLPENELEAAVNAVADLIDSLQDVDAGLLFSIDLEPSRLEQLLRQQPRYRVRSELAEPAQLLFDRLLQENCAYIVDIAVGLPDFSAAALTEVLRRETEISDRVKDILSKIPQPAALQADADQEFDLRYRRHVARELDTLELFGLNLSENTSRYDLSIAYITLSASRSSDSSRLVAKDALQQGVIQVDEDIARDDDGESDLRVDEALACNSRHLIRGEAGSGKTTLLRWLAVTASRNAFTQDLRKWNGSVPFFLQLRRYANETLPSPEDFINNIASTISGLMPRGWVHRQLYSGRALVLIDGVDELPERQRLSARKWLYSLLEEFPDCRFVITTRPPAVPSDWLQAGEFGLFELLPMATSDITTFVQHWHDAAKSAVAHVVGEEKVLSKYEVELNRVINAIPTIRNLATTPLLCAMLCALNRERRTQLPRDRMELYRVALESLLDRRDAEREISQHEMVQLSLREKQLLLENLAYWLVRNDQTDVATPDAIQHISDRLSYMTSVRGNATDVFKYLLTRSGLIREPIAGRVDFIHRTFQEYLAAARAISQADIPLLVQNAHDDGWREVVILSAGHANEAQCNALLMGLLDRGNQNESLRHRLHLLAVACLETAIELSPAARAAVQDALAGSLPPGNMTEARAVASAGPLAAPLLTQYCEGLATTAAACVRTLCLIGGEQALTSLEAFRLDRRVTVRRELVRGWDSFDRTEYARRILADSMQFPGSLEIDEIEKLSAISFVPQISAVRFNASQALGSLATLPNLNRISGLSLRSCQLLESLDGIDQCEQLQALFVSGNSRIREIPALPDTIENISLRSLPSLTDILEIARLPNLFHLNLSGVRLDGGQLAGSSLQSLMISEADLAPYEDWVSALPNLQRFSLNNYGESGVGVLAEDFEWLSNCELVHDVAIWNISSIRSMQGIPGGIERLHLQGAASMVDASAVGELSRLEHLMLDNAPLLEDYSFLRSLDTLGSLDLEGNTNFEDLTLVSAPALNSINVARTRVQNIEPLVAFSALRLIHLDNSPVVNLDPLREFSRKLRVTVSKNQLPLIDNDLRQRHNFRIVGAAPDLFS
jgi:hypothetical protein